MSAEPALTMQFYPVRPAQPAAGSRGNPERGLRPGDAVDSRGRRPRGQHAALAQSVRATHS
jgi:hypothetical protein